MKRRERLEKGERERFDKNMARMLGGEDKSGKIEVAGKSNGKDQVGESQVKWVALRGFITQTLEVREEMKPSEP